MLDTKKICKLKYMIFLPLAVNKSQKQAAGSPRKCMISQEELNLGASAGNKVPLTRSTGMTSILMTQLVDMHGW